MQKPMNMECPSPGGAIVHSQGRKPLEYDRALRPSPVRGDSRKLRSPVRGLCSWLVMIPGASAPGY
jgi:hypothetical protein